MCVYCATLNCTLSVKLSVLVWTDPADPSSTPTPSYCIIDKIFATYLQPGSCITQVFSENCNTDITLILQSLLDNHDERCLKIFQFLLIFCWEVCGLFEHPALHHSTDWSCVQNIKTSAQKLTQTSTWL